MFFIFQTQSHENFSIEIEISMRRNIKIQEGMGGINV